MVPIEYMIKSALGCDTAMSRAMLRACGIRVPASMPAVGAVVSVDAYADAFECFRNHGSPMDGRPWG